MSKVSHFVYKKSRTGVTAVRKERNEMHSEDFMDEFDRLHPNGNYVTPGEPPRIRIRDMHKYCKSVGKKPMDLTEAEMDQFRY
ncbi:hypothetical protein [Aquibacillus saliphilus]|uniref:hypothetical protein n=1 Tax=Aquibacillus saliphilus TaxID=1909422 RepID=UPI001CF03F70|nr:hypothetical protein [Aquibacillus saliphilus]